MVDKTDDMLISMSVDLAVIRRAMKKLEGDIAATSGNVVKKFEAMGKGIDNSMVTAMQVRIDKMTGIGAKAAKEWNGALSQQGAELDKLRQKYNPVFAAVNNYKTAVVDIQRAQRLGAISADEMAAAIQRERKATLDSIAAIKGRNTALSQAPVKDPVNQFNTANLAAQFQDIAVTSAMGMSPLQIALQQGTQISAVLGPMGAAGAVKSLGAAFLSVISPVSLVTIALVAGSAAAIQYVSSLKSGLPTVDEALKSHADLIQKIEERWPSATEGMKRYAQENAAVMEATARQNAKVLAKSAKDAANAFNAQVGLSASITGGAPTNLVASQFKPFEVAINRLRSEVKAGKPDFDAFYESIKDIVSTNPSKLQEMGDKTIFLARSMEDADQKARGAKAAIGLIGAAAAAQIEQISQFTAAMRELAGISLPKMDDRELAKYQFDVANNRALSREDKDDAYRSYQAALARIKNQERLSSLPVPGEKPNRESEAPEKVRTSKTERKAERDANAYRDLVKSAQDRIDQMQLEEQLIGKTGVAADTLRMRLDLLQRAQDKGRELSPQQQKELEALAHAYGEAAQKVAALSAAEELRFEREQMFRSPAEQRVAGQLRNMGLDANSDFGQLIAGQIRLNEKLAEGRDLLTDISKSFNQDLMNGVKFMDALANAAGRLGMKLLDMASDQAITALFGSLMGSFGGGGGFQANTTLGNFLKGIPGFANGTNNAPGGLSLVGERGPELLNIPRGGQVIPNDILRNMTAPRLTGPRVPSMPASSGSNVVSMNFAPVINAPNADKEGLTRVEGQLTKMRQELPAIVIQTVRESQSKFVKLS